ncbi:MAG: hypothetical protein ACRCYX_05250 [Dermatophilaceae bacterium]
MSTTETGSLLDQVRALADEAEQSGSLPQPLVDHLAQEGYLRMAAPTPPAVATCPLPAMLQRLTDLAAADASTAWTIMAWAQAQIIASRLAELRYQQLFTTGPDVIMAASSAGTGCARPVGGALEVSGEWRFASGISHARWILVHCDLGSTDATHPIGVLLDRDCVVVDGTWQVLGLRATASHGLRASRVQVPMSDTYELDANPCQDATLHSQLPFRPSFALHMGAVGLGVALATIHEAGPRPDAPELGAARLTVEAAQCALKDCARNVWDQVDAGGVPINDETAHRMAAAGAHAAQVSVDATVACYRAGGSAVIFNDHPLQRRLRDALTISQHVNVSARNLAAFAATVREPGHRGHTVHS